MKVAQTQAQVEKVDRKPKVAKAARKLRIVVKVAQTQAMSEQAAQMSKSSEAVGQRVKRWVELRKDSFLPM